MVQTAEIWVFELALMLMPPCFLLYLFRSYVKRNTLLGPREDRVPLV